MKYFWFAIVCVVTFLQAGAATQFTVQQNRVLEWSYHSSVQYTDPFHEIELAAEISGPEGSRLVLTPLWSAENEWRFRFSAGQPGT